MTSTSRLAPTFKVELDGVEVDGHVLSISRSMGGAKANEAVFQIEEAASVQDPMFNGLYVQDLNLLFEDKDCKITLIHTNGAMEVVHRGRTTKGNFHISDGNHRLTYVSRLDKTLFGKPVDHSRITIDGHITDWDTNVASWEGHHFTPIEPEFNPVVEGLVFGNKHIDAGNVLSIADINSIRLYAPGEPSTTKWKLKEILLYVFELLNSEEEVVRNPTAAQLDVIPALNVEPNAIRLKFGSFLPEILDDLLGAYGLNWYINFSPVGIPEIRIVDRNEPGIQIVGDCLDYDLSFDRREGSANRVIAIGAADRVEDTWYLIPAWKPEYDSITDPRELSMNSPEWDSTPEKRDVWRKWALNENGDYNNMRPGQVGSNPSVAVLPGFGWYQYYESGTNVKDDIFPKDHRLKFESTLTLGVDGNPVGPHRGTLIEWWNGSAWAPVHSDGNDNSGLENGMSFQLMDDECAIYWTGTEISKPLLRLGLDVIKLRVTATVSHPDYRMYYDTGPNGNNNILVMDMGDRYKNNERSIDSIYEDPKFSALETLEINEFDDLKALADSTLDKFNRGSISGTIVMHGVDWRGQNYLAQQIRSTLTPRVELNSDPDPFATPNYPTCTGVVYDVQNQRTIIQLDSF